MVEISIILSLLFSLFCFTLAAAHSNHVRRMTLLDWSVLAVGGMYGIGWSLVLLFTQDGRNPAWENWITPFKHYYVVHNLSAFFLLFGLLAGWHLTSSVLRRAVPPRHHHHAGLGVWNLAFWGLLLLAVSFQGLYTRAYGGYLEVLEYSNLIRSALFGQTPVNPWSFLRPFGGLAMISAYGFFGVWLSGRRSSSTAFGFLLSFFFSNYILYSWLGRIGFLVFLLTFILGWIFSRQPNPIKLIALATLLFATLLGSAYGVSLWLDLKSADSLVEFLAKELSFPFASFFAQLDRGENIYRGFVDLLLTPIFLLPSSWWSDWYMSVDQVNTAVIMGAPKGEGGVTGGIPVDLLTLGLMQLHIFGVLLIGGIFSAALRALQFVIDSIPERGIKAVFEAHVALKFAVLAIFYAQPNLVVSGNFEFLFSAFFIILVLYLSRVRLAPASNRSYS